MGALIATIFTVLAVALSTIVVTNPSINFDNRSSAKMVEDSGVTAKSSSKPATTTAKTDKQSSSPTKTVTKSPTNPPSNNSTSAQETRAEMKDCQASGGTWSNNECTFPNQTVVPTTPSNQYSTSCDCVDGVYVGDGCGAKDGKKCGNTSSSNDSSSSNNSTSAQETRAEMKDCQASGGTWSNNECTFPNQTVVPTTPSNQYSTSCDCVDGVYVGDGCGAKDGKKCGVTPTASPTQACIKSGGSYNSAIPCCADLVKVVTPYGAYCGNKGDCTPNSKICQKDGVSDFEYVCDASGYFQKYKRCDFGCNGNSCLARQCTPGETKCSNGALQTCNTDGSAWKGQSCDHGCETLSSTGAQCKEISCTNPAGTPGVSQICNNAGGYNFCADDGKWYSKKCDPNTVCIKGLCSSPVLKGIGEACSSNSDCQTGYCYSGSDTLGGSPFDTKDNCHANPVEVMDELKVTEAKGTIIGSAIVASVAVPEILLVANIADDATTVAQCALTQDPVACQWAFASFANPVPGTSVARETIEETADLLKYTDDAAKIADNLNDVSLRTNNALQNVTTEETLTLYHGSQGDLESILNNGIYGVSNGGPTLSNQMMETPLEFASGNGVSIMQSSQIKNLGGYIVEVNVPQSKVVATDLIDDESYFALSANNQLQPNAFSENHVTLSPDFIKNIYPVSPNGVVNPAIPEAEWAAYATQYNATRNIAVEEQTYLRLKSLFPNESEEFIQNLIQSY